ncbi:MAG: hypothetical protein LBU85_11620 [Treponema sp.]|jgi:hypothetical protein|nr:hypothetical protein [Treponema sp.]
MKNVLFIVFFCCCIFNLSGQQFTIPAGAELIESAEFKNNGIPYIVEQRYRLRSGDILYVYYDVEGSNSITFQRIEQAPILALGENINIPGLPGYREFNFGDDRRRLVQFMKLFKLGQKNSSGRVRTPSLSDYIFELSSVYKNEFKLLLDLYDETWVLEHHMIGSNTRTYAIVHTNRFSD